MSAGVFVVRAYSADYDNTQNHPIQIQPETLALEIGGVANGDAVGNINNPISAVVSKSMRSFGLNARRVTIKFAEGQEPEGYKPGGLITLPWLRPATFQRWPRGTSGTYLGADINVISTRVEEAR